MVWIGYGVVLALPLGTPASAGTGARTYTCQPSLSMFCRNIHVSCAGTTTIRTKRFVVSVSGNKANVTMEGAERGRTGQVYDENGILIELSSPRDWIRIEPGGRYTHRIYRNGRAAMSYGYCQ